MVTITAIPTMHDPFGVVHVFGYHIDTEIAVLGVHTVINVGTVLVIHTVEIDTRHHLLQIVHLVKERSIKNRFTSKAEWIPSVTPPALITINWKWCIGSILCNHFLLAMVALSLV